MLFIKTGTLFLHVLLCKNPLIHYCLIHKLLPKVRINNYMSKEKY